jgi:hypothetical protein
VAGHQLLRLRLDSGNAVLAADALGTGGRAHFLRPRSRVLANCSASAASGRLSRSALGHHSADARCRRECDENL